MSTRSRKVHYAWIVLGAAWLINMGTGLTRFVYPYVVPAMEEALQISHARMASAISWFFWADAFMKLAWGAINDRLGPRFITLAGLAITSVGLFLMSVAKSLFSLSLGFAVMGMGAASLYILPTLLLSRWFGKSRKSSAIGIATTASSFITLLSGFAVPKLLANSPFHLIWRIEAFIVAGILVLQFVILRNSPEDMGLEPLGAAPGETAAQPAEKKAVWEKNSLSRVLKSKEFYQMAGCYSLFTFGFTSVLTFLITYLQEVGWGSSEAAHLMAIAGLSGMVLAPLWGLAGDRLGKPYVVIASTVSQMVAFLLFAFGYGTPVLAYTGALLFRGSSKAPTVLIGALQGDYFDKSTLGTSYGLCAALGSVVAAVSPIISGALADYTGTLRSVLYLGAGSAILASLVMLSLARAQSRQARQRPMTVPG